VIAVGGAAIDLTPIPVKNFAIVHFGSHDKTVLLTGIYVVLALFAMVTGILARRRIGYGLAGLGLFAVLGVAAAATRPVSSPVDAVPTVVGVIAGALVMALLVRAAPAPAGMSTAPVATAASSNPVLSALVTAVKKANLVDTLNSAKGITVFAPENSAFAAIPSATLTKVLANKAELTKILTYHVVGRTVSTGDFSMGTKEKTLEGAKVTLGKMGSTYTVNGAKVVCGDVTTSNATVYIIGSVLMPKS
jgi:uncharacterized surface protein with fasciclin (FAS1) repeats